MKGIKLKVDKKVKALYSFLYILGYFSSNAIVRFSTKIGGAINTLRVFATEALAEFRAFLVWEQAQINSPNSWRRGMGMVIGVVVFIAVAISIAIGYIVLATTVNSAAQAAVNLTSSQSVNLTNIATAVTGAFLLLTVLPTVLAAALIIGALFLFMRLRGGSAGLE